MVATGPVKLEVNHVEIEGMEWGMTFEEILGDTGRSKLNVQDRTNSWEPECHWDVKATVRSSGWVLFRGEINAEPVELLTGFPWRTWQLDCIDYNNERTQRKVGAFDGKTWMDQYGLGFFVNVDPNASTLKTDRLTVQNLFDTYIRVDGAAFETNTYVGEYLTDFFPISWSYSDLQQALEELAALVIANLQFWSDPDLFFHWVTIPAWQDLNALVAVALDPTSSGSSLMFPEGTVEGLALAPVDASDIRAESGQIGFSNLKFNLDGSNMPEQIYVRGGTGYAYNAPPIPAVDETKTVVSSPISGVSSYDLTFLATTKLWVTDSTGFISTSFSTVGASGPFQVKYVYVPWSESRHKGGHFWQLLNGPNAGKLVDNDTNILAGYGSIRVDAILASVPGAPSIGIGGSGWVGEVAQDRNKRQAYLEAPVSVTQPMRDSLGGQALYRGQTPTLRGSMDVYGLDGWRVGQIIKITDERLPSYLNGGYFVIQAVKGSLIEGNDLRRYTLEWGDGPTSRYSAQSTKSGDGADWPPPAIQIDISIRDLAPGPNSTQVVTGQLINGSGGPWAIEGKTVNWSFECYNGLGVLQVGQGTLNPTVSITDKNGRARTTLVTGSGTGLVYYIFANVVAV